MNRCIFEMPAQKFNVLLSFLISSKSMTFFSVSLIYLIVLHFSLWYVNFCWVISVLCLCFIKAARKNFSFGKTIKSICVPEKKYKNAATIIFFAIKSLVIPGHFKSLKVPASRMIKTATIGSAFELSWKIIVLKTCGIIT